MVRAVAPLPPGLVDVAAHQAGLLRASQCLSAGVGYDRMARLVRAGLLVPRARGVYLAPGAVGAPRTQGERLDQQRLQAAVLGVLAHGPTAVATGYAALVLLGVKGVPADFQPEITLRSGGHSPALTGVRIRRVAVRATMRRHGVDCVVPEVALAQAVVQSDRRTAVTLMDSARSRKILTSAAFARARGLAHGKRGAASARTWWDLSDLGSQSPAETWARLSCLDAGVPPDALQLELRRPDGRFVARVDLAWLLPDGRWLLGEIDGIDWHSGRRDVLADLTRQNRIVTSGTVLRRWTGTEAGNGTVAREAAILLRAASWTPATLPPKAVVLDERRGY